MKLMIASDIHGSARFTEELINAFALEGADRLLLLGDLLYHGARNDLPKGYDTKRMFQQLNGMRDSIIAVRGNCDSEVDQMVLEFPMMADSAELFIDGVAFHATHGHMQSPDAPPKMAPGTIFCSGHMHVPVVEARNGCIFINPGSVSLPKEGSARGYMTVENGVIRHVELGGGELAKYSIVALLEGNK